MAPHIIAALAIFIANLRRNPMRIRTSGHFLVKNLDVFFMRDTMAESIVNVILSGNRFPKLTRSYGFDNVGYPTPLIAFLVKSASWSLHNFSNDIDGGHSLFQFLADEPNVIFRIGRRIHFAAINLIIGTRDVGVIVVFFANVLPRCLFLQRVKKAVQHPFFKSSTVVSG